jgi:hypothetical protein
MRNIAQNGNVSQESCNVTGKRVGHVSEWDTHPPPIILNHLFYTKTPIYSLNYL